MAELFDYEEAARDALEIITEFGSGMRVKRIKTVANKVTETVEQTVVVDHVFQGVILPASQGTLEAFDVRFAADLMNHTDTRFAILAAHGSPLVDVEVSMDSTTQDNWSSTMVVPPTEVFTPRPTDILEFWEGTFVVLGCTPLNVNGTPVIYSVGLRRP